jgi:HD-like signal output (HDOD) protein/AmiR/NasT family two-component response regulator
MMTDQKPHILFVDDEARLLEGLRRYLHAQRSKWTMSFAQSGQDALASMEVRQADVVVSDMRMPQMDGAELLRQISERYPNTARIVLSGYSERESIFRTIGPAHQYFSKPCPTPVLIEAIDRALTVRRVLADPRLVAVVAGASTIPTHPKSLTQLLEILNSNTGSVAEVAQVISEDVGLTANLLKLTNSGFFFLPKTVSSVLQAVRLLGFELIQTLVAIVNLFGSFSGRPEDYSAIEMLQQRSLMVGQLAKRIAEAENMSDDDVERAYCAGMLSHVGSFLQFANWPEQFEHMLRGLEKSGGEISDLERTQFGASHAELGGTLLALWGFSDNIVEAVLFHHDPSRCGNTEQVPCSPLTAVHAAQSLVQFAKDPKVGTPRREGDPSVLGELDWAYLKRVGVDSRIPMWTEIAQNLEEPLYARQR